MHGFNLVNLLERRTVVYSNEAFQILRGLDSIFQHLEPISGIEDLIAPWNVYFDFAPSREAHNSHCLTSRRLRDWPSFRLKARLGPTMVDFTRPIRSEWEEIVRQLENAFPSTARVFTTWISASPL